MECQALDLISWRALVFGYEISWLLRKLVEAKAFRVLLQVIKYAEDYPRP